MLYELREIEGFNARLAYNELCEKYQGNESDCSHNLDFLKEMNFIKDESSNTYKITDLGVKKFKDWERKKYFIDEFEKLSNLTNLTPQQRGRELEKLIANVLEFAGWRQEANVTTAYEQIDVVIHKNREFYLIECKWEGNPIEADVVDKLFGKLSRRAGTNGILVSMSGFTKGCIDCVKDFTNQKLILLFGKGDVEQIISNPHSFDELLNEKIKELVMRRKVIWQ